jgi:hypothetical protein
MTKPPNQSEIVLYTTADGTVKIDTIFGSPYKAVQVWEYCPILLCNHLIFHYVLPENMISNLLKLLTRTVL